MAIRQEGNTYYGLSTDTKPTGAVLNGREFREMDTGKKHLFDAENGEWLEQPEEGGGGGGGSSTLSGLTDVDISNPTDGQTLVYNSTSGKWENGAGGSSLLVIGGTYDENEDTITLNKTWNEIHNALISLAAIGQVFINYGGPNNAVQIVTLTGCGIEDGIYSVDADGLLFRCWDADAYPTDPLPPEPQ